MRHRTQLLLASVTAAMFMACAHASAMNETKPAPPRTDPARQTMGTPPISLETRKGTLLLSASLSPGGPLVNKGIVWRVFADQGDGSPAQLLEQSQAGAPSFVLEPGIYIVHAAYGLAGATRRIVMGQFPISERLVLNAGGLTIHAVVGDTAIPDDRLRYSVYVPVGDDPEGRAVVEDAKGGTLIRLPEGNYRVVSTYGDSNAIMSTELKVEAGKVTQGTMRHKAATVTLKLVIASGGEALANTTFSVLTPGGDTIREVIGAFPSMTLAEGEYVAIARNAGQVFTQEFTVRSGFDRDVEVMSRMRDETPVPDAATRE